MLLAALSSYGCSQENPSLQEPAAPPVQVNPPDGEQVQVAVAVVPAAGMAVSRVPSEDEIRDVNFYLYASTAGLPSVHLYSQQSDLRFECLAGRYEMFVIANAGLDLGDMPYEVLIAYEAAPPAADGRMTMIARRDIVIEASSAAVRLEPVEVVRVAAKISYKITVASQCADIRVRGVQVISQPRQTEVFAEGMPAAGYIKGEFTENPNTGEAMVGSFYMLPNLRGEVPAIADQTQKNGDNAPDNATYLLIHAVRGAKVLSYRVYLGGNNTSDFNVRANTHYTFDITLRGDNESDVRVSSYRFDIQCEPQAAASDGVLLDTAPFVLTLKLAGDYNAPEIGATLLFKGGDMQAFGCGTMTGQPLYPLEVRGNSNAYRITYTPENFAREHAVLTFSVMLHDRYGEIASCDFTFIYAHKLRVYTEWFDGSRGNGSVLSPDALRIVEGSTLSSWYYDIYCPEEGCLLTAVPDSGYVFDGWCTTYDHMGVLSYDEYFRYDPLDRPDIIYAFFR